MQHGSVTRTGSRREGDPIGALVAQIGRLVRHPAYRHGRIVSPMLQRHLPEEADYAWAGEDALRARLERAGLDGDSLDHLLANVRAERARLGRTAI